MCLKRMNFGASTSFQNCTKAVSSVACGTVAAVVLMARIPLRLAKMVFLEIVSATVPDLGDLRNFATCPERRLGSHLYGITCGLPLGIPVLQAPNAVTRCPQKRYSFE